VKRALVLLGILTLSIGAMGASVTYPVRFNDSSLDSVRIVTYDDWSLDDSSVVKVFPSDTTLTLDNTSVWKICYHYYWTGAAGVDTMGLPSCEVVDLRTWASSSGDGDDTLKLWLYDDTGATFVGGVTVTIKDASTGSWYYTTNDSGWIHSTLTNGGDYWITSKKSGYVFPRDSTLTFAAGDDTVHGYNTIGTIAADTAGRCVVYGLVTDADENPVRYAQVTFRLPAGVIFNECDSALIATALVTDKTNASGVFETPLTPSSCLGDKDWLMTVTYKHGGETYTIVTGRAITVPDAASYQVIF